jgi:hypothetical protein
MMLLVENPRIIKFDIATHSQYVVANLVEGSLVLNNLVIDL